MSYDPIGALVTWLKTQATLTAQVSTRIWGGAVPRSEQTNMPRKCLTVLRAGGRGPERNIPDGVCLAYCRCYGATLAEANAVYNAFFETVHRKHHIRPATGQLLASLFIDNEPIDMIEPATDWPFVQVNLEIRYGTDLTS